MVRLKAPPEQEVQTEKLAGPAEVADVLERLGVL
jgi:hypothetical protein